MNNEDASVKQKKEAKILLEKNTRVHTNKKSKPRPHNNEILDISQYSIYNFIYMFIIRPVVTLACIISGHDLYVMNNFIMTLGSHNTCRFRIKTVQNNVYNELQRELNIASK